MTARRSRLASIRDSRTYRSLMRSALGRRVLASAPYRGMVELRRRTAIDSERRRAPEAFDDVATCFLFMGHTKSGGSLVGSMLDAHPEVVCADELGLARLLAERGDRDFAFRMAARIAAREASKGRVTARRLDPYSLAVPGGHQGRSRRPRAVGDSRAGPTTRFLAADPSRWAAIEATLGDVDVRVIHVVRNPFDPIAAMVARSGRTLTSAIDDYVAQCERIETLAALIGRDRIQQVRYDDLVADPPAMLVAILGFLGVAPDDSHLSACSSVVTREPWLDRHRVDWPAAEIDRVLRTIDEHRFLGGYRFEVA